MFRVVSLYRVKNALTEVTKDSQFLKGPPTITCDKPSYALTMPFETKNVRTARLYIHTIRERDETFCLNNYGVER